MRFLDGKRVNQKPVAIVGCGVVGAGMLQIFPDAIRIDPPKGIGALADARACELAIVCVPTPIGPGGACDVSIVEDVVEELEARTILIKSTVAPGTCAALLERTGKALVFSPEYMGESRYWTPPQFPDPRNALSHGFMILGGNPVDCSTVIDLFLPRLGPATRFRIMRHIEAELVKYFENAFFSLKVAFANETRRICEASGANYHAVREGWLDDPRVGPMHTAAFADAPGFAGKCLPKDLTALAAYCRSIGLEPALFDAVLKANAARQGARR